MKSKPLRKRIVGAGRPERWFAKSRGDTKLKRVLYFARYPSRPYWPGLDGGMDLNDLAHEAVVNGNKGADDQNGFTSVQGDFVLCKKCSSRADDIVAAEAIDGTAIVIRRRRYASASTVRWDTQKHNSLTLCMLKICPTLRQLAGI